MNGEVYEKGTYLEEGSYNATVTDETESGRLTYKVVYDKSAPVIEVFDADGNPIENDGWFSGEVTVRITDLSPTITTAQSNDIFQFTDEREFTVTLEELTGDTLELIAIDTVQNLTATWKGNYFSSDEFENEKAIRNAYKTPSWYNVRLPKNRFVALSEDKLNYSFATYAEALAFAKSMEEEHQVEPTASGWTYSTADNYSNRIVYTDRVTLDVVIEKWVTGYISDEQTFSTGSNAYYNEPTSLTVNTIQTPSALGQGYPATAYFIHPNYVFKPDEGRKALGLTHTVIARYMGEEVDGFLTNTNKISEITLVKDGVTTFAQDLAAQGLNYQGFFQIRESDDAGNELSYIVYYDLTAPNLTMTGYRGDADANPSYDVDISSYDGEIHFTKVEFGALTDNRDDAANLLLKIDGRGGDGTLFNATDTLPTLSAENDCYGLYTVTVYDRTCNVRQFEFYVAPETLPDWSHTSLSNDERLKLTFSANYRYNSISELTIYKVSADGTKTALEKDDNGTEINFATLEYIFYTGGKYQAEIVDIYGRRIWTKTIFYQKGLPEGMLSGVTDGGATRRDVTFTCDDIFNVYLYVTDSGENVVAENSLYTKTTYGGKHTLTIIASETTTHCYLIAVHNADNPEVFVEYTFEIDTVCADVFIYDAATDTSISYDGVSTNGFYLRTVETGVTFTYYLNDYGAGLNLKRYTAGTRLYIDGTYYFTAKDYLGNTREFTVLCDTVVSYEVAGAYTQKENGVILAGEPLTVTVLEKYRDVTITRGMEVYNNAERLLDDGTYNVYAEDVHGNQLRLVLIIDQQPPVIALTGVTDGGITKERVTVIFDEGSTCVLTNAKGGYLADVSQGQSFTADGSYYLLATDEVGNTVTASFFIRTKINVTANIVNKQVTTDAVKVTFESDVSVTVLYNGQEIEPLREYTQTGSYVMLVSDEIGNETRFEFVIIEKTYREYGLSLPDGWNVANVRKDNREIVPPQTYAETGTYTITVTNGSDVYELILEIDATPPTIIIDVQPNVAKVGDVSEPVTSSVLYKNGAKVSYRLGDTIDECGSYRLELTDALGNTSVYKFEVPYALNVFAIVSIVAGVIIALGIIVFLIKSKKIKI